MHYESSFTSAIWPKKCNTFSLLDGEVYTEKSLIAIRICKGELFDF
jgi:hypothetical protein